MVDDRRVIEYSENMQEARRSFTPFFGNPTEQQLAKIRQFLPAGAEPIEASELVVVSLVLCDNFMRRDGWNCLLPQTLAAMKRALPGSNFTRDHDLDESAKKTARIFDSRMTITDEMSADEMAADGFGEENAAIFKAQGGHIQLWVDLFMRADSPLVERFRFAEESEVSYHGRFLQARLVCSDCNCSDPNGIWGYDCQMLESGVPWERILSAEEFDFYQDKISLFEAVEAEGFDPLETSLVTAPAYSRSGLKNQ